MNSKSITSYHKINWPVDNVLAFSTTRQLPSALSKQIKNFELEEHPLKLTKEQPTFSSPYNDFNLGLHVGDNKKTVGNNRAYLSQLFDIAEPGKEHPKADIQWLEQVHGNSVAMISSYKSTPIIADAAITQNPDIALAIMTADCLPILITNQSGTKIAAIHAGWRPLAANIIERTINKMAEPINQLHVWLGPCIGKNTFEVGEDVKASFISQNTAFKAMFILKETVNSTNKYYCDLAAIAKYKLRGLGVNHIKHLEHCTFERKDEYFSYRRDHQTGRMASIIKIRQ